MAGEKQLGNIVYQIEMDVAELIAAQQKVNQRLDQMDGSFNRSAQSAGKFESVMNKVGVAIAAAFTIDTAKRLIEIGDEMITLQARVTRLSSSVDEAKLTMAALSNISSQTGNSLSETERLWESLTSALKETGATNAQILALTSTLQKIGTIDGSSTEEMANALRQFGQSISGGIVRAEEFNSILEQMPELARQIASGLGISIGQLRQRMLEGKLSAQDALNAIQQQSYKVNEEFDNMPVSIGRAKNSLDVAFKNAINDLNQAIGLTSTLAGLMQSVADNLNFYNNNTGDSARMPKLIKMQQDLNKEVKEGQRWYETDTVFQQRRGQAAFQLKNVEQEIASIRAQSAKEAKNNQKFTTPQNKGDDAATAKLVKNAERRLALSKREGEERARLQAQYDAEDAGLTDKNRVKSLQDQYAATYRNTDAQKKSNQESKTTATQAAAVALKLESLKEESELAAESTKHLSREQQLLRAEQSLGANATEKQKKQAREYKAAALDAADAAKGATQALEAIPDQAENKSYSESVQNLKAALNARVITQEQYNSASEKIEAEHQANLAKIISQEAVSPQQQAVAQIDPVQQLANENAQKLSLIKQFEQQRLITEQQGLSLRNAANTEFEKQRTAAMWEIFRNQNAGYELAAAAFDSFAGNASNALTGILTGSMSVNEAMRSLGSTILNSIINSFIQMGVEYAKNLILQQTLGSAAVAATSVQAAAAAAAWATPAALAATATLGGAAVAGSTALASTVAGAQALALAGACKNGGPVSAGLMYRVGEGGMPEIYQASTGKQYMIPGDNGKVISNKDMQSGGGIVVNNVVENYSSGAQVDTQATRDANGNISIQTIVTDIANGGQIGQAIQTYHNAPRRAVGG